MNVEVNPPAEVVAAAPAERPEALALLLCDLLEPARGRQIATLLAQDDANDWEGLFVARRGFGIVGAIWAQLHAGRTAAVYAPRLAPFQPNQTAVLLLAATVDYLAAHDVRLAQALLPTDGGEDAARLRAAGFQHAADLLYLASGPPTFPNSPPAGSIEYVEHDPSQATRLAELVERTYEGTLDCPQLNGVRQIDDVLAGYRAVGRFDPAHWLEARHAGEDVGCLLLSEHPETRSWELVYMGLLPAFRGLGWGVDLARWAQWIARQAGASV